MECTSMRIEYITEHEDGGATIKFDLEYDERMALLQYALKYIMIKTTQEVEDE